ncbi:hypothetical protein [Fournierella massiliensis]|uniref:hypothetical protein n=1 Tax=Allofournierella massiliensis TaxID=1650663 RepID=UPI0035225E5C
MAAQPKTLAVVTGTRAEYGLLRPVIQKLLKLDDFILKVLVTGAHLAPEFGNTVQEIEADGGTHCRSYPHSEIRHRPAGYGGHGGLYHPAVQPLVLGA